jgi:hypothetical protein
MEMVVEPVCDADTLSFTVSAVRAGTVRTPGTAEATFVPPVVS